MLKAGTHASFVEEVEKSIADGRVRELSDIEMEKWHGPVHYVTVFAVVKPGSVSTQTRVVSNSALKNSVARLSLNDCMHPGPNALAALLDCLIFWRGVEVAVMMDMRKAYQAIHTSEMELHLRRFLHRSSPAGKWKTYGYTRANFGDLAAGLMLEVGKRRIANLGMQIDPLAAQQLKDKSYVDDSILGGSRAEAERMRGDRVGDAYTGTVARILAKGAMTIKFMAISGSTDDFEEEQLGGKCLGVGYRLAEDEIEFRIAPCFYVKKAASSDVAREVMVMGVKDVAKLQAGVLGFSRRQALSMVMGLYDPLGLVGPVLLTGKLLLRRLYAPETVASWDQDLPAQEKQRWASWFTELQEPYQVVFPRATRPQQALGLPRLAGFCDSSELAVCAIVYVVWDTQDGGVCARILMAKCRVAPLVGMTIPRGEMQSLTILSRLLVVVAEAYPSRFASISTFTDSMCSIGALAKISTALKPFFGNRVSEILQLRAKLREVTEDLAPVHHIPGEGNPADVGTRPGVRACQLGPESLWQQGPPFLKLPYDQWPTTSEDSRSGARLPGCEVRKGQGDSEVSQGTVHATTRSMGRLQPTEQERPSIVQVLYQAVEARDKLGKLVAAFASQALEREKLELSARVLARVLGAVLRGERAGCERAPSRFFVELAVQLLVRTSSDSAKEALKHGKLQGLGALLRGGVVWIQGRVRGEALAALLGTTELPVLMAGEPLAKSLASKAHRSDHRRSPQDIAARTRRAAWIVGSTRLAKSVAARCYGCRLRDKKMAQQQMGGLPAERTTMLAPFEAVALDLFGPYRVKDPANGRRAFKCWVVAFACLATKAASLLACPGYSTAVFVDVFHFFAGIYGKPRLIYTDHAPSLVKAAGTHDWADIALAVGKLGTEWRLTAKGCSWRNGQAERLIRSARHTLGHELARGATLDFHQFSSTLSVVASILNTRPLSVRTTPDGDYIAVAPRDVLLGRAGKSLRRMEKELDQLTGFHDDEYILMVDNNQARIVSEWRKKWLAQVFPDLVPRTKWKQVHRCVRVNDIGLLKYEQKLGPNAWRLVRVVEANPGSDGLVRTITVEFRPRRASDKGASYRAKVPQRMEIGVQRFAVMLAVEEQSSSLQLGSTEDPTTSEMTEN